MGKGKKKQELIDVTTIEKKECAKCHTLNDFDANFCRKCGTPIAFSYKKSKALNFISTIFKILSITIAIDVIWMTRPLMGTAKIDNIIIEYSLLLIGTLFCSTCFRLLGEGKSLIDMFLKKNAEWDRNTYAEMHIIFLFFIGIVLLCIYTNTRIIFLKPGSNYVERKVGNYIQRWYKVNYERVGVKKCDKKTKIFKSFSITTPFCYDYTYRIIFRDRDSCFIHYTSQFDHKINKEDFSYCAKK